MSAAGALYRGSVVHRRFFPRPHAFRYSLFLVYLDLDRLDRAFAGRWLWSARKPAVARFRREDHFGDPAVPLADAVRDLVAERTGGRPAGPVRLLTHLSYFGYCFNPVSFYFCFDTADEQVEAVVAEVNNTPWGERHCYVLGPEQRSAGAGSALHFESAKELHVSPFLPMDLRHRWRFTTPGETPGSKLAVKVDDFRDGERVFTANLALERRPMDAWNCARALLRFPWMTARVVLAIYWQALKLKLKGIPFHPHPRHAETERTAG